ncbi:hypothetical protein [Nocardioides sp.]|uniref:hypothetical protein n=1 Tax=Nocardioides sp. TaxID=35761 RepID=UPI003513FB99
MAKSPAHSLGQIIGYALEQSILPLLRDVADAFDLYLDVQEPRPARNGRKHLKWIDEAGNGHNLDFVLERGGSRASVGIPVAFIESAWRRYTKHSVNKAGEMANALIPLRQTHARTRPFLAAVVAGVWTEGGLQHLRSQGIEVLYVPLTHIVQAFARFDIDVNFDEGTPLDHLQRQVDAWDALSDSDRRELTTALMAQCADDYAAFRQALVNHLERKITRVVVLPLYGAELYFDDAESAASALMTMNHQGTPGDLGTLHRVEVQLRFSNGDRIEGAFTEASDAATWLQAQM